jgi:hypothetical protein
VRERDDAQGPKSRSAPETVETAAKLAGRQAPCGQITTQISPSEPASTLHGQSGQRPREVFSHVPTGPALVAPARNPVRAGQIPRSIWVGNGSAPFGNVGAAVMGLSVEGLVAIGFVPRFQSPSPSPLLRALARAKILYAAPSCRWSRSLTAAHFCALPSSHVTAMRARYSTARALPC